MVISDEITIGATGRALGGVARQTEVHDAHLPRAGDHHVLALEIAVDQLRRVRGREPAARGDEDVEDLAPGAPRGVLPVRDGVAVDELHRDEDLVLEAAHVVDHDDVGVRKARDRLRLAQQARLLLDELGADGAGHVQQLDRDLAIELGIVRGVDVSHRAPADQTEDQIAADGCAAREQRCIRPVP